MRKLPYSDVIRVIRAPACDAGSANRTDITGPVTIPTVHPSRVIAKQRNAGHARLRGHVVRSQCACREARQSPQLRGRSRKCAIHPKHFVQQLFSVTQPIRSRRSWSRADRGAGPKRWEISDSGGLERRRAQAASCMAGRMADEIPGRRCLAAVLSLLRRPP